MTDKKPKDSHNVTPYLAVKGAAEAIKFYEYVFGGKQEFRLDGEDGKIMHASIRIGDSQVMLTEQCNQWNEGTSACNYVYLDDPDAAYRRAMEKGAKSLLEPRDRFYVDRMSMFVDPYGQVWSAAVHIEDVSMDELKRRSQDMGKKAA